MMLQTDTDFDAIKVFDLVEWDGIKEDIATFFFHDVVHS